TVSAEDFFRAATGIIRILDALRPPLSYQFVGELNDTVVRRDFHRQFTTLDLMVPQTELQRTKLALNKQDWVVESTILLKARTHKDIVRIPIIFQGSTTDFRCMWRRGPTLSPSHGSDLYPVPSIPIQMEDYFLAAIAVTSMLDEKDIHHAFAGELKDTLKKGDYKDRQGFNDLNLVVSEKEVQSTFQALSDGGFASEHPVPFNMYFDGKAVRILRIIPLRFQGTPPGFVEHMIEGPSLGSPAHSYKFPISS
ncbi:hypothetical protein H0H93_008895, partial [Arthromyces matolae]